MNIDTNIHLSACIGAKLFVSFALQYIYMYIYLHIYETGREFVPTVYI